MTKRPDGICRPNKKAKMMDFVDESSETMIRMDYKKILDNLVCPICWDVLAPPVRLCQNGHCICPSCFKSIDRCGLCRGKFSAARCYAIESMLENASTQCIYKADGCSALPTVIERKAHEKSCPFRPVKCHLQDGSKVCWGEKMEFRKYRSHLLETHNLTSLSDQNTGTGFGVRFYDNGETRGKGYSVYWPVLYFTFDDKMFLIRNALRDDKFSSWCTIVGTEEEARSYKISVVLGSTCPSIKYQHVWKNISVLSPHKQSFEDIEDLKFPVSKTLKELTRYSCGAMKNPINNKMYKYSWSVLYECKKVGS